MTKCLTGLLTSAYLTLLLITPQNTNAGIVAISGNVTLVSPPASAQLERLTSETQIIGFFERQGVALAADLSVSATALGTYGAAAGGTVLAGYRVSSYLFHADTLANLSSGTQMQATVMFDTPVLGIIFERNLLNVSDVLLGLPSTSYAELDSNSGFRELELAGLSSCGAFTFDCVSIGADGLSVTFNFSVGPYIDEVRIVTSASIPEPSTLLLCAIALTAFVCRPRRVT